MPLDPLHYYTPDSNSTPPAVSLQNTARGMSTLFGLCWSQEGGGVSKVTAGSVLTASMTSHLASVTLKMAAKVVVDEADKIVEFLMDMLNNVIRFGDNKIPIVIEIQNLVPLLDETFRSVMNFNDSFLSSSKSAEQSYQPVRLSRASAQQVGGV